ncbi:V-set and immunoglobulin domain-containing protein 4-like isoform X1 [Tyto alba]|uniref:V-set and immunoglobulin domain-containing protein 4-like isoform X1 n=1 Tax=Tyto alba TaxID=56313 RepID=UPI001C66BC95|nr:V-set and immunoglobulin domain-containing protein 4-like isoform X1 [Tyto alba]
MAEVVRIVVFVMAFISCNALLDLSGVYQVKGTWMESTTLPCTYVPSEGFTQQTLRWSMERDYSTSTIFRRDDSGDHILLSQFRGRVSVPKHSPGDASLLIKNLEIPDSGHYTCQVIWRSENNSLITKEVTTTVKVVKVAVTKPIIRASELGLTFLPGARTSLTCVASGSPPISYRWFRGAPGGEALLLSSQAELAWDSLQPSDTGKYYCEAENRVGDRAAQQSDVVELTVRDLPTATPVLGTDAVSEGPPIATGEWSRAGKHKIHTNEGRLMNAVCRPNIEPGCCISRQIHCRRDRIPGLTNIGFSLGRSCPPGHPSAGLPEWAYCLKFPSCFCLIGAENAHADLSPGPRRSQAAVAGFGRVLSTSKRVFKARRG